MSMDIWKDEILRLLRWAVESGDSSAKLIGGAIAILLLAAIVLNVAGNAFRFPASGLLSSCIVTVVGALAIMLAVAAVNLYVRPKISGHDIGLWLMPGTALAAVLVVVVPLTALIQRAKYFQALVPVLLALAAAAFLAFLVGAWFESARKGGRVMDRLKDEKNRTENFLRP